MVLSEGGEYVARKVGAVSVIALFILGGIGIAWAISPAIFQGNSITIIVAGRDNAAAHTTEELARELPPAQIVNVFSPDSLTQEVEGSYGTLILVGHGLEDGVFLAEQTIPWRVLGESLEAAPAHTLFVATCYSEALRPSMSERSFFGFSGLVDVDEAAFTIAALYYAYRGNIPKVREVLSTATDILWGKFLGDSSHPLLHLTHDYHTKTIRNIWHVRHQESALYDVEYTHPDNYYHYTWVGPNTAFTRSGSNLFTAHIKRDDLTVSGWVGGLAGGLGAIGLAALAGPLAAAIVLIAGLAVWLFIELYVKAEQGDGWQWIQNLGYAWWGLGFDWKLGGFMWVHFQQFLGITAMWPLFYGGDALGIDGW